MMLQIKRSKNKKEPKDIEFGTRLKVLLKKRELTQLDACQVTGLSTTTMHFYTTGRRQMRVGRFAELVNKLSLTIAEVGYLLEAYWGEDDG